MIIYIGPLPDHMRRRQALAHQTQFIMLRKKLRFMISDQTQLSGEARVCEHFLARMVQDYTFIQHLIIFIRLSFWDPCQIRDNDNIPRNH